MSKDFIVDFQNYGLEVTDSSTVSHDVIKDLGDNIVHSLKTYNFCYLKNHGVDEQLLKDYREVSRVFFEKPMEFKVKYPMGHDYRFGWVQLEREKLNEDRSVGDLHEAFNYSPTYDDVWPPVEKFELLSKELFTTGRELAYRFCDALSLSFGLPMDFMRNAHKLAGQKGNSSATRTLFYPPVQPESIKAQDQVRLGEHADWGTLAFNFQDNVGGLEVKNPQGEFVATDPIPDTVLVTVGLLLQRWTSDSLIGSVHRILIPKEESRRKAVRQAAIFFLNSDDDYIIKCLDGSDKYEPITIRQHIAYKADKHIKN